MFAIQHILVPVDFSECSEAALPYATALARKYGAKITLLHVVSTNIYVGAGSELVYWDQLLSSMEEEARKMLAATFSPAERAQLKIEEKVVHGIPFSVILEEAQQGHVDLIVMATHGRTGLSHAVLGSVAERVVRLSPVPVLTIHPQPTTVKE
jgi:nucleotide-binding universal stress UspA family protein